MINKFISTLKFEFKCVKDQLSFWKILLLFPLFIIIIVAYILTRSIIIDDPVYCDSNGPSQ